MIEVFGIGNPLIDIIAEVDEADIDALGLDKGIMRLVDLDERTAILDRIKKKSTVYRPGGSCPNTMIFLSALGVETALAGAIGDDELGKTYAEGLPTRRLVSQLAVAAGPTGTSIILVTPDAERTMNTYLGVNRLYRRDDLDDEVLAVSSMLYFTGYMWDTDPQKEAVLHAVEVIRGNGGRVAFDLADPFAVNRNRDEFVSLIRTHADIVFANAEEARLLYGSSSAEEAAERIAADCELAVVKDGSAGSVIGRAGVTERIGIRRIRAVDTTGAGDMYAAGFLYGLLRGFSDRDAGVCGAYLASRIVETFGAQFTPEKRLEVAGEVLAGEWRFTD